MNENSGYTPGPWHEYVTSDGQVYVVDEGKLTDIDVMTYNDICYIGDMEETTAEDHANARLIAAAPELLELCREANEFLGGLSFHHPHLFPEGLCQRIINAIVKAEAE